MAIDLELEAKADETCDTHMRYASHISTRHDSCLIAAFVRRVIAVSHALVQGNRNDRAASIPEARLPFASPSRQSILTVYR